jgi:hypothetical protein
MSAYLDRIITAVIDNIKKSGLLAQGTLSGTVSAVGADGTVTVTRNADTYPKVRLVGALTRPVVGSQVLIHRTIGGWVLLGRAQTSSAPRIQRGEVNITFSPAATNATTAVTFPAPFAGTPTVVASISVGAGTTRLWQARPISATSAGFTVWLTSTDGSSAALTDVTVAWIATDI